MRRSREQHVRVRVPSRVVSLTPRAAKPLFGRRKSFRAKVNGNDIVLRAQSARDTSMFALPLWPLLLTSITHTLPGEVQAAGVVDRTCASKGAAAEIARHNT